MYTPRHFDQTDVPELHRLMRTSPLATLITHATQRIDANHIPLLLLDQPAPLGTLIGHVARANPLWHEAGDTEVLAIFHGPNGYVSPGWYPSKRENARVVPTWNYTVVHARGRLRVIEDQQWLREHVNALSAEHEAALPQPWSPADAPGEYLARLLEAIVGIEIEITELQGKWKLSQNQSPENRRGVISGLEQGEDERARSLARQMEE